MKVLISDKLEDEGVAVLRAVDGFDVDIRTDLTSEELKDVIGNYDAIIIRSMTVLTEDIIESGKRLKVIGRAGVGIDNVDVAAAKKNGIEVFNTPNSNTVSTAELTIGLMLALARNISRADLSLKSGEWKREAFRGHEIGGQILGIIGLGNIGSAVANIARAFGMEVIACDPYVAEERANEKGIKICSLEALLRTADFITIHVPQSSETVNMISDEEFDIMKSNARLINCARGSIVNEDALARALKNGKIAGAAVDVYLQEPPDVNAPIFRLENCLTTPHLGAATFEAKTKVAIEIAETVRNALIDNSKNCVLG